MKIETKFNKWDKVWTISPETFKATEAEVEYYRIDDENVCVSLSGITRYISEDYVFASKNDLIDYVIG